MSEEILINVTPMESRVAVIENGVVQELYVERAARRGLVGNIYKGKVVRVLPGMQAAFIDIGLSRTAFLHAHDIVHSGNVRRADAEELAEKAGKNSNQGSNAVDSRPQPSITELLHDGKEVLVQVIKDMIGSKGARLSSDLSIPSRYLVYMPYSEHVGVSTRIENNEERERLRTLMQGLLGNQPAIKGGFIVRTAAEDADEQDLAHDMDYLLRLWRHIQDKTPAAPLRQVIYEELPLHIRAVRDLVNPQVKKIRIDSRENHQKVMDFANEFVPDIVPCIEHYPGERPIFDLYGVEDDIQKALSRKVMLKSGGYLIIDQTEAMTTIDVNTGSFVGHRNLEDTVFKTNLEAAHVIARQLRLRNLGGIIILDFIDMENDDHKQQVMRTLEKMLARDHARTKITAISDLGLVEMTRKRTRESLEQLLCEPCAHCEGRGSVKSSETVCYEIFREILREARAYDATTYTVIASQQVVDKLQGEESAAVADLEAFIGKAIRFQAESMYAQEQFDVVLT